MYSTKSNNNNSISSLSPKQRTFTRVEEGGSGSIIRKVHSLDCVRLHGLEFKGGWTTKTMDKASRFSRYTVGAGERYVFIFFCHFTKQKKNIFQVLCKNSF